MENIIKTGKITAKLRDAVPVCLMVEGKEVKRYKNIDLPDMLKEVEMLGFHFNVPADGKITFEIDYAQGVLPEVFPVPRAKMTRTEKAAVKAAAKAVAEQEAAPEVMPEAPQEATALAIIPETPVTFQPEQVEEATTEPEPAAEAAEPAENTEADKESSTMEISYNVTDPRRKELATAIGEFIGMTPVYMKAPTYGFAISNYILDRNGTLRGEENKELVEAIAAQGFTAA